MLLFLAQATQQVSAMPDIPQWLLTGGVSAVGPLLVWWLIKSFIPTLMSTHKEALDKLLADSKADRETFSKATEAMTATTESLRVHYEAEQSRLRHASNEREQAMLSRLDLKDKQIERLILRSTGPTDEPKGQVL